MLDEILIIIFMALVGALIGGWTNAIAIKMLFRPHEAKYIGKWRVPFTPGLIPKRRKELAKQLGQTIIKYLLTPGVIEEKLKDEKVYSGLYELAAKKVNEWFDSSLSVEELFLRYGIENISGKIDAQIHLWLKNKWKSFKAVQGETQLGILIPTSFWKILDAKIPDLSADITGEIKRFAAGPEGRKILNQQLEHFFAGRGMFFSLVQNIFDQRNMADKLQQEIVKIIGHDETKKIIEQVLRTGINRLKKRTFNECLNQLLEDGQEDEVWKQLREIVTIEKIVNRPIRSLELTLLKQQLINRIIPKVLQKALHHSGTYVERAMRTLNIPELVEKQVDTFSTKRIEEIVLGISRRELKMIMYLGAYLGGLIGVVQGVIVLLTG